MYAVEPSEAQGFEFKIGEKTYSVPRHDALPMPTFRKIRKRIQEADDPGEEGVNALFDLFDEFAPGALDSLTFEQAIKLVNAYTNGEGDDMGEFSTSSD